MTHNFDVAIVGAGVVGLMLGSALAKENFKVVLIEANTFVTDFPETDYAARVSAITRASENVLKNLKVWDKIAEFRVSPYRYMQVFDDVGKGEINFSANEVGETNLGHIIENQVIQKVLYDNLKTYTHVTMLSSAKICQLDLCQNEVRFALKDNRQFRSKLIIGADGAKSWLRQTLGFDVKQTPYQHVAIICHIKTELKHQKTARQVFLTTGVLAFLPFKDENACSIVWSTTPEQADYLMQLEKVDFAQALESAFAMRLGKVELISKRCSFPLIARHAENYVKQRVALIGDAAHTIHPLAGQGINLGIEDVAALAEVLTVAYKRKRDIGALHTLRKYERARKGKNQLMLFAMSGFKELFSANLSPVIKARSLGLNFVNQCKPIKHFFINQAMGRNL